MIRKEILEITDTSARVRVRLYLSRDDEEDKYIAEGYAQCFFKDEPYKENFLEEAFRAETRAALTDAGFSWGYAKSENGEGTGTPYTTDILQSQQSVPAPAFTVRPSAQNIPQYFNRQAQTVISAVTGVLLGKEQRSQ